jgi:hypothetical protein
MLDGSDFGKQCHYKAVDSACALVGIAAPTAADVIFMFLPSCLSRNFQFTACITKHLPVETVYSEVTVPQLNFAQARAHAHQHTIYIYIYIYIYIVVYKRKNKTFAKVSLVLGTGSRFRVRPSIKIFVCFPCVKH